MKIKLSEVIAANAGAKRCEATSRMTGEQCRRTTKVGRVCYMHGKNIKTKRRQAAFDATDSIAQLYDPDSPPVTDPFAELARLGGIARNGMDVAGRKVNDLQRWYDTDDDGRRTLKAEIQLWMQLVKFCESVLTNLAKLGLEDRMVRIEEAKATALLQCLSAALNAVPLESGHREAIEEAFWTNVETIIEGVVLEESPA